MNERLVDYLGLSEGVIEEVVRKTFRIIRDRFKKFRMFKPVMNVRDKTVILVDDGLASGYTMLAAIRSIEKKSPKRIIVAVPTASTAAVEFVSREVDKILCLNVRSSRIFAVADAYRKWRDLADDEVVEILRKIG